MTGTHIVHTVFGTNSSSTVASGSIPFHNARYYNIKITNIDIAGIGAGINLASLEIAGQERSAINIRAVAAYASQFKGNTAVITFMATLI